MTKEALQQRLARRVVNGALPEEVSRLVRDFIKATDWIKSALEYAEGTHNIDDVFVSLLDGERHLWMGENCFIITEFATYPRKRIMNYFLAGGERGSLTSFSKMLESTEKFARANGCDAVTLTGRPGWVKTFLKGEGFRRISVTMAKELPHVKD